MSPEYTAVMLKLAAVAKVVVSVAVELATVAVPSDVAPLKNVTVPVAPVVTVAVSTTFAPTATEAGAATRVVVEADFVLVTATALEVEAL